jgi:hypothetical protein
MVCRVAGRKKQVTVHNFTESNSKAKIIKNLYSVPLATEPGISLIILPLMRILQRNLKRTYLIV